MKKLPMGATDFDLSRVARVFLIACSTAIVALLLAYVAHFGKPDFSSDDAVLSMQAESMWEQGSLFPEGWVYNNGDLLTPSGTMLIAPLLTWFPNSYELHAVAGIFAVLMLLGSMIRYLVLMKVPAPIICVAVAIAASGLSRMSAIMLYLQTTYIWWPAGFLLGAAILLQQSSANASTWMKPRLGLIALSLIVFLLSFTNPGRALLMLVLPLYVFDRALEWSKSRRKPSWKVELIEITGARSPSVVFGIAIPFLAAFVLYRVLFRADVLHSLDGAAALRWDGLDGVGAHARIFASGWIDYLGGERATNGTWSKLESILRPLRIVFAVWLSWVGVAEILRIRRHGDPARVALVMALIAAFLPIFIMYLAFAPLAQNYSTIRYFTVAIIILIVLAATRIARSTGWRRQLLKWLCLPICAFFLAVSAVRFVPGLSNATGSILSINSSPQMRLAKLLVDEGLEWGYATWWNAGATTVLSEGKARVSPVAFSAGRLAPYPAMRQSNWYSPEAWGGETFVILSRGEAIAGNVEVMDMLLGKPLRIIDNPEYRIFVYAENIASTIACNNEPAMAARFDSGSAPAHAISAALAAQVFKQQRPRLARVVIRNDASTRLSGQGPFPIVIGIRLVDLEHGQQTREWVHWPLPCGVDPGQEKLVLVDLPELPAGKWRAEVNLLQEGVIWFDQLGAKSISMGLTEQSGDSISDEGFDATLNE